MYYAPKSLIQLYRGVPLDTAFEDTLFFSDIVAQNNYFISKQVYSFENQSFTRISRNKVRIEIAKELIEDCNYIGILNVVKQLNAKKYYGFITNIEYVNNETTDVTYVIDPLQTYHFDYVLTECLVEREHSATDNIGDNVVPETIGVGTLIDVYKETRPVDIGTAGYQYVVAATFDENLNDALGELVDGVYSGLHYNYFASVNSLNQFLTRATEADKIDGIVSISLQPLAIGPNVDGIITLAAPHAVKRKNGFNAYNNKLNTAPYRQLFVTNNQGSNAIYKYEFFDSAEHRPTFLMNTVRSVTPCTLLTPVSYNHSGVSTNKRESEYMSITYPMLSWNSDTYKAWVAQNRAQNIASAVTQAALITGAIALAASSVTVGGGVAASAGTEIGPLLGPVAADAATVSINKKAMGLAAGLAVSAANNATRQIATIADKSNDAATGHSPSNSELVAMVSAGYMHFSFIERQIRPEYVDIVDDYFSMFGYATNLVKVPNRNVRQRWTYTKTIDCHVVGNIPADAANSINTIFNKGIRFWNPSAEFRNFHGANPTL